MHYPLITISQSEFMDFVKPTKLWVESLFAKKTKAVAPMISVLTRNIEGEEKVNVIQVQADLIEREIKDEIMRAIGARIFEQEEIPIAASMVSEAWMAKVRKGESGQLRPRDNPDRIEAIVLSAADIKHQHTYLGIFEIDRDSEGVISLIGTPTEHVDGADTFILDQLFTGFWNKGLEVVGKCSSN